MMRNEQVVNLKAYTIHKKQRKAENQDPTTGSFSANR